MFPTLFDDPIAVFKEWFGDAKAKIPQDPNAVTLATLDAHGYPSARIVLLKGYSTEGFVFFTNYQSDKGQELTAHPKACLNFYWPELGRQVRVKGWVEKTTAAESDEYFAMRPRGSQVGAWASDQSRLLLEYNDLVAKVARCHEEFGDKPVARPPHWGGWRLVPLSIEFWKAKESRLHKRVRFERATTHASWHATWLNP